jgi:HEAT repeat protein
MQDKDEKVRVAAIRAVAEAGPDAIGISDQLITSLRYKDKDTRDAAVNALAAIGQDIGPQLAKHLNDRSPGVREGVVRVISRYGNLRDEYQEQLIVRLGDYRAEVRVAAINALTQAGEAIVPRMRRLLSSNDIFKQFGAARILGDIGGPEARKAIPKLRELKKHEDSLVRKGAEEALKELQ